MSQQSKRYNYSCASCSGKVTKAAVAFKIAAKATVFHGLHGWSCENCGTGAKVQRTLKG